MNTNTINITNNRFYDLFKVKIGSQVSYKVDFSVKLYVFDNYKFIEKIWGLPFNINNNTNNRFQDLFEVYFSSQAS